MSDVSSDRSSTERIPREQWEWFGTVGHLIVGRDCRFHLCTIIGDLMVSTVGEYLPDSRVRDILAESRGIELEGQGDAREADWLEKNGFEEVGYQRTYETMVFRVDPAKRCTLEDCGCGMPEVSDWSEITMEGYKHRGRAHIGHYAMCERAAEGMVTQDA